VVLVGILGAVLDRFNPVAVAAFSTQPTEPVAIASATGPAASLYRAQAVAIDVAMSLPAMRKGHHVICGKPSTFGLSAWQAGTKLDATDPRASWLRQPDPRRTLQWMIFKTLSDGVWHNRCVWKLQRNIGGQPSRFTRLHPSRIDSITDPHDPDIVDAWIIDGNLVENMADYVVFDFAGLGGLRRFGWQILELYADLQVAAGNYAKAPHPKAILKNHGPDLDDDVIDALLADWEARRDVSSVGYLNDAMDYETTGWNPEQLQLIQSREHAALEVARLLGLPAKSVDAKSGDPMTYGNVVEWRRDELEAIRPWLTVIEQTLSLDDRTSNPRGLYLPYGVTAAFDVADYLRESPLTRMQTWETGLRSGALDLEDVKAAEPLARSTS
jgi:HK97 family phage portal protein